MCIYLRSEFKLTLTAPVGFSNIDHSRSLPLIMDYYYIMTPFLSKQTIILPCSNRSVPEQSANVITGYVHKISEVHTPTKGNVYFDFNLQLSPSKVVRGVCYSPEKRAKLKETQQKKIHVAVKIDNVQALIGRRRASEQEYTVNKISHHTIYSSIISL